MRSADERSDADERGAALGTAADSSDEDDDDDDNAAEPEELDAALARGGY